jgi:transposase
MAPVRDMQIYEIVRLHGVGVKKAQIARKLQVDPKTVKRWTERCGQGQNIQRRKSSGRRRVLDDATCKLAESLLLSPSFGNLKAVVVELNKRKGIQVSTKTLSKWVKAYCKRMGRPIKASFKKPVKQLSKNGMLQRVAFCEANRGRNWGNVMFTDRCRFYQFYPGEQATLQLQSFKEFVVQACH